MSQTRRTEETDTDRTSSATQQIPESRTPSGRLAEETSQGKTTIAPSVVQKIGGIAAREISGVFALGGGVSRAFGAIRERVPGGGTPGVQVEVGEKQAALDLDIVVEYGASIVDLARAVRRNVITSVEQMTGLQVVEVNIGVSDIQLPDGGDIDSPARVE